MQQIWLQYLVWFENYNYSNLKVHFLSEQAIKLRFWCKNNSKFARSKCNGLLHIGRNAQTLIISEIHAKADQHCKTEDCFVNDMKRHATGVHWLNCHIVSKQTLINCCCCSWRNVVDIMNTPLKYWLDSWHSSLKHLDCWRKAVQIQLVIVKKYITHPSTPHSDSRTTVTHSGIELNKTSSTHVLQHQHQADSAVHNTGKHHPLDFCMYQVDQVQQPNYTQMNQW